MPSVPWADGAFDCAYSINCVQFWPDKAAGFAELWRVLRPGGRIVIALQPRHKGATEQNARRAGGLSRLRDSSQVYTMGRGASVVA